ncbi:hypothetical protein [Dysgonomonas sp. ZJ709]|uniref:hypothetical protein n=1 Tax=Dysgonomonas sp. ZJ709 TaxID=2709797 RepID=UPI0013EB8B24|nr:hypothetical protein [Dysgonomonas sp. ZJ709]
MKGLLYPAMHKFYSALNSLEQFGKGKNFFDNISYLDNFFSEYRNVTFVLQKSLAHTEYKEIYEEYRAKYLINETCKWFLEKRNEVLKQQPFDLEKVVIITIYSPLNSFALPEQIFTIENDIEYSSIIDSLRAFFRKINPLETFFSVEFSFYEKGKRDKELYESFISGINQMKAFLNAMKHAIKEDSILCDQLQEKINSLNFYRVPKNMLFIDDYVYYGQKNNFEKSSRVEFVLPPMQKIPVDSFLEKFGDNDKKDIFSSFITMHIVIFSMQKRLMPTFMIVYDDNTFDLKSFDGSIKTTMYRKVNETAQHIKEDNVKAIFYVAEMLTYSCDEAQYSELLKMSSRDRIQHKTSELLCFFMLDKELAFKSYRFNTEQIDNMEYVVSVLRKPDMDLPSALFLTPIRAEFEKLKIRD